MSFFHFCSFCHKCQKPLFYTLCLSSCISIRTRFGCVFFRHCIVKILANASAFTAFLPRTVEKNTAPKILWTKNNIKQIVFRGGRSREYCRILRPTTLKNSCFIYFWRVRVLLQLLSSSSLIAVPLYCLLRASSPASIFVRLLSVSTLSTRWMVQTCTIFLYSLKKKEGRLITCLL